MALLTRTSSWLYSRGRPPGLSHEDVLLAFLMRTSSWPYSRGRPRGLNHEDVLVALLRRTSSWLLHEDAYNRQTRLLENRVPRTLMCRWLGARGPGGHALSPGHSWAPLPRSSARGGGHSLQRSEGQAELAGVVYDGGGGLSHPLAQPERREGRKDSTGDGDDDKDGGGAGARGEAVHLGGGAVRIGGGARGHDRGR